MTHPFRALTTVLLVEDDPHDVTLIRNALEKSELGRFVLHYAQSLAEGLACLEQREVDIVLLDLNLPDCRGFDSLTAMREHAGDTPIIVLTGAPGDIALTAVGEGAHDLLKKGVDADLLARSIVFAVERRKAKDRLTSSQREAEASHSLLHTMFDSTAEGILVVDMDGKIVEYNRRFVELWRIPDHIVESRQDEAALRFVLDQLVDPEGFRAKVTELYAHPELDSHDVIHFKDQRVFERASRPHRLGDQIIGRVWTFRDVTEQTHLREKLVLAERMATIGTLAAGIGHEINNPLSYVMANLEMLMKRMPDTHIDLGGGRVRSAAEMLAQAREGADRIRQIVKDLKTFTRSDAAPGPVDVHALLDFAAEVAHNEIKHRARFVKDYGQIPVIQAGAGPLGQLFLNLLVNAAQSIPEGNVEKNVIRVATRTDERGRAVVEVHDSGAGIAPEHLPRIFEPFFTTKQRSTGTGLGLSICRGIVEKAGGEIVIESAVGRGTTFRVTLPLTPPPRSAP